MNEIKVIFSRELEIDLAEFIEVWNNTPECREIAQAQLTQQARTQFAVVPPEVVEFLFGAVVGGAFYEILRQGIDLCISKLKSKQKNALSTREKTETENDKPTKPDEQETRTPLKYKELKQEDGTTIIKVQPNRDDSSSLE